MPGEPFNDLLRSETEDRRQETADRRQKQGQLKEERSKGEILSTSDNPCRDYFRVWDHLGILEDKDATLLILDMKRLVVPCQARQKILKTLNLSQKDVIKTYATVRTMYFWPSLKENCQQLTQSCTV